MSTRLYPAWKAGSTQLRIFLPNFWMKLIKPTHSLLPNQVQFIVSSEMTKYDVAQYLEKIYKVPVVHVNLHNRIGKTESGKKTAYVTKQEDHKIAYVTMPTDYKFEFPDLFPTEKKDADMKQMQETKRNYEKRMNQSGERKGVPAWFTY